MFALAAKIIRIADFRAERERAAHAAARARIRTLLTRWREETFTEARRCSAKDAEARR